MFIRKLYEYYIDNKLEKDSNRKRIFPDYGWGSFKASYVLALNKDGSFHSLKEVDRKVYAPDIGALDIAKSSNIAASHYHGSLKYVLGCSRGTKLSVLSETKKLDAFIQVHEEALKRTKNRKLKAMVSFLKRWRSGNLSHVQDAIEETFIESKAKGEGIIISVQGKFLHDEKDLKRYWDDIVGGYLNMSGMSGICLVTGEEQALRLIHGKIKGVKNSISSGASLISFNQDAHKSYSTKDAGRIPIGCKTEFGYRTALNYFLSNNNHNTYLGDEDDSVVFWTGKKSNSFLCKLMKLVFGPQEEKEQAVLKNAFDALREGRVPSRVPDENDTFYVAILSGNNGRVYVRDFMESSIGDTVKNVQQHYEDTSMIGCKPTTLAGLAWATLSKKAKDKKPYKNLYRSLLKAILTGQQYPRDAVVRVLQLSMKSGGNCSSCCLLKGFLNRGYRIKGKKEIGMALDKSRKNVGYLLGRMLAVADEIHERSIVNPNKKLSDRFRSSLGSTPRLVFRTIADKVEIHLSKLKKMGKGIYLDRLYASIISELKADSIPAILSFEDQSEFVIGYRHQNTERYTKKEKKND